MIAQALEAEVEDYLARFAGDIDEDGKRLVVRNGRAKERGLTVGSGTMRLRAPRVNDKRIDESGERQKFSSRILPAYARRSPKVTDVLPILYLRGLSTGDFGPALRDLLGEDASGLSSSSISRLTEQWQADHAAFGARSLRFHRYAYLFIDGVHMTIRLGEDDRLCLLAVIGVREDGEKELLAVEDGYRESSDSWAAVFDQRTARKPSPLPPCRPRTTRLTSNLGGDCRRTTEARSCRHSTIAEGLLARSGRRFASTYRADSHERPEALHPESSRGRGSRHHR